VKLGLQLNSFEWNGGPERFGSNLMDIARTVEAVGFDRIAVTDHVWQHPIMGGPEANEPECYTTLAFLAANTERVGLTAMVSGVHFRHPAVLVKAVTTLDVLSGGRAWLGIGSGHPPLVRPGPRRPGARGPREAQPLQGRERPARFQAPQDREGTLRLSNAGGGRGPASTPQAPDGGAAHAHLRISGQISGQVLRIGPTCMLRSATNR
jgi:hypothetical protein